MAFIHETHLMPSSAKVKTKGHLSLHLVLVCAEQSSGKVKTKSHLSSHTWFLQVVSTDQKVSCSKQEQIKTLRTFGCYRLHPSCGIILIDGVYS